MELGQPVNDYKPRYNEYLVKQLLSHYKNAPDTLNVELIEQIKQDAEYYGLDTHIETDITLSGVLKQAGAGFISGFTTFNVGEEPENVAERISRNVANLAGFVGYIPALPAKAGLIAKAASHLKGKSVPMLVSGKVTETVRNIASKATREAIDGRAGAFKTMSQFLQKDVVKNTMEGSFHLGVASAVSSWQGGVDEMMHGFIGGAQTGAAFRVIGNFIRLPGAGIPKFGAKWGELSDQQQAERMLKTVAASMYTGLPATMRGETAPEQIYEYLLGAYFGMNETPAEQRTRDKQIVSMFRQPKKDNPFNLPELSPGWEKLSPREQKLVTKERDRIFNEAGEIISTKAMDLLGQSYHLPELKEESGKKPEMPEASTDVQFTARDKIVTGVDINKEAWKEMSKEDKEFYAEAVDASNLSGLYNWYEIKGWTRPELETVAGHYKVNNIKKLNDAELGLEIMFAQSKRADGYNEILKDINKENTVVIDQQEAGEAVKDINPSSRSEQFSERYLTAGFENLNLADKHALISSNARKIELKIQEIMLDAVTNNKSPDSREFMDWAVKEFGYEKFDETAHNMMRQWFKLGDPINVKQVPFISARVVGGLESEEISPEATAQGIYKTVFKADVFMDELATNGTPVDMMGNKKLMRFPKNRLDLVAEQLVSEGKMESGDVYSMLDNVILSNPNSGMSQKSLYRYKEYLEQLLAPEPAKEGENKATGRFDYKGDEKTDASMHFYKHVFNIMKEMYKKNNMHYQGGSGDKERAYFVKEHPGVMIAGTRFKNQLNEIVRVLSGTKRGKELLELSREQYIDQYFVTGSETFEPYDYWLKNKKDPNVSQFMNEFIEMHDRAFVSNFLWDMQVNGLKVPDFLPGMSTMPQRFNEMSYAVASGMLSTPRQQNKRAQIWNTNGFKIEDKFIEDGLELYNENVLKLSPETYNADGSIKSRGGYRIVIIKDSEYSKNMIHTTDGSLITHDKIMELESREAGMPESSEQGQSKSFIVSPHTEYGAILGKYMEHAAGKTLSKAMEEYIDPATGEQGIHKLMYESAAKQSGIRVVGTAKYNEQTGKLEISKDTPIYHVKPSDHHIVLSELQSSEYITPHSIPSQPLSSLTTSSLATAIEQKTVDDMLGTLIHESYHSHPDVKMKINELMQNPKDRILTEEFFNKIEEVGINELVEILSNNRFNHLHDRIYQHIAKITRKMEEEASMEGEKTQEETAAYFNYVNEFQSTAERLTGIGAKIGGEYSVPVISTLLGREVKPWMDTVLSKYIIEKATRPKLKNSITARMRPYDFRLRQVIKNLTDKEFYLDEYFRKTPIHSSLKDRTLGEIWDKYEATTNGSSHYSKEQMAIADGIFRSLNLRVPMDSISGGRVLQFKGFTGRKGHGVLLTDKVMEALGGADLDGDKAHIFFGGRNENGEGEGMKQSWLDMYKSNEGEFTRYRNKQTGEIRNALDFTGAGTRLSATTGISVMRGSLYGNPFVLPEVYDKSPDYYKKQGFIRTNSREEAIDRYDGWLRETSDIGYLPAKRKAILNSIDRGELTGKTLKYFKPGAQDSHAVRLQKIIEERVGGKESAGVGDLTGWEEYTAHNKEDIILHGPDKGRRAKDIFTVDVKDEKVFNAINDKAIAKDKDDKGFMYYSPWARQRMSESSAMGRFTLGNVVILKKTLSGAHNVITKLRDKEDHISIPLGEGSLEYDIVAKTDPKDLALFRQLAQTGTALGSDPMNELGLKGNELFRDKLFDSLFEFKNVEYINEKGEVSDVSKKSDWYKDWFVEPSNRHKVIYKGVFKEFAATNNAYYGKDWREGKQHTLYARQEKAAQLATLPAGLRNSILPKIAKLIDPLKMEDSLLQRLNLDKVQELYDWFATQSSNPGLQRIKHMVQRAGFTVTPKKDYMNKVFEHELWKKDNRDKISFNEKKFYELFGVTQEPTPSGEGYILDFQNALSHTKLDFNHPRQLGKKLSFEETVNTQLKQFDRGKSTYEWRKYHVEELVKKTEHFIDNDIKDMVSVKHLYDVIKKHNLNQEQVDRVTKLGSIVRGLDRQMQQARTIRTGHVDGKSGEAIHRMAKRGLDIEGKEPSATHQSDIESYVLKAKKGMSPAEQELFDTFVIGSLHRSDKVLTEQVKQEILDAGQKIPDELEKAFKESAEPTSKTSVSAFGLRNARVSDKVLENFIKDTNDLYNFTMDLPTTRELKDFELEATVKAKEPQKIKDPENKVVNVEVFEDPTIHLHGLREASKKTLDKEGEKIWNETEDHLTYYHNSVGKNLPEVVSWITGKDMNAMNYEDWRNVNNFFKTLRTQSLWDKFFNDITLGKPEIMKRYWHLFPETVNRRLMLHDFVLMDKAQIVMRKDGLFRNKIVKMPTHQLGKEVHIMGSIQHSMASANEEEQDAFHRTLNPLLESHKEGQDIYELAMREMERDFGHSLLRKSIETGDKKFEAQASNYLRNYNVKKAEVDFDTIMAKIYKVPIRDKKGNIETVEMTGEEYKNHFIDVAAERNQRNYEFQLGNPEFQERFALRDSDGRIRYFDKSGKNKEDYIRYDLEKVYDFLMEHVARGKNIPKDMGVWLVNGVVREYQYNISKSPEHRKLIASQRIRRPEKINFREYFPHVIMDVQKSQKEMMSTLKSIVNKEADSPERSAKIQKILWNHHLRTGDWLTPEIKQWDLYDTVVHELQAVGKKVTESQRESYLLNSRPGFMEQRSVHMDGWTIEPRAYDIYMRQLFGTYYRNMGQFLGRHDLDKFVNTYKDKWGEELTEAWRKYISIYINNASGFPANLPPEYLEDPLLNVKGTPYAWWADNNVVNKVNKVLEKYELSDKDIPVELRGMTQEKLKNWSNLEAKWQLAALLAHPKTAVGNLYGGSALTIANTGWRNFKNARSISFLKKLNPGKDQFGNEWNTLQDVSQYIYNLGVMPEMITYEMNLSPEVRGANAQKFMKAAIKKIQQDPEVKDSTLKGMMQEYGIAESFWNKAAYFMRSSERILRRDSFMAHLIQAWENYGGALPHNHPVLIEHAKKGVKATQFLYNAPYRPMFAQTQLGKVLTRFQLWSWNSVRFRNDVLRDAAKHGFREGTMEYDRFVRTAQLDLFMLAMSSIFMYSLFESALPAPWNWFQDTADWLLGDEKERDRAFFGAYPTSVAPLQMITPPVARMLPATFKGIVEQDWSKMSDYVVWTMFPFGRMARDVAGPNSIIENPTRTVEKFTGLPYIQFGKVLKEEKDKKKLHPTGLMNF